MTLFDSVHDNVALWIDGVLTLVKPISSLSALALTALLCSFSNTVLAAAYPVQTLPALPPIVHEGKYPATSLIFPFVSRYHIAPGRKARVRYYLKDPQNAVVICQQDQPSSHLALVEWQNNGTHETNQRDLTWQYRLITLVANSEITNGTVWSLLHLSYVPTQSVTLANGTEIYLDDLEQYHYFPKAGDKGGAIDFTNLDTRPGHDLIISCNYSKLAAIDRIIKSLYVMEAQFYNVGYCQ